MNRLKFTTGILPSFRIFVFLRLLWSLLGLFAIIGRKNMENFNTSLFVSLVECFLLFVYLSSPLIANRLGRIYLPLGLSVASLGPWVENLILLINLPIDNIITTHPTGISVSFLYSFFLFMIQMQMAFFLLIPLVLISWQYKLKWVVFYTFGMTGLDIFQIFLFSRSHQDQIGIMPWGASAMTGIFLITGYIVNRLSNDQKEINRRLSHHAETLEHLTTSRERNRIAREIHDTVAHTLSGLAVNLEAMNALWDKDSRQAKDILQQSLDVTRNGLIETRRAIQALRAGPLEDLGLLLAIRQLAISSADGYALKLTLNLPPKITDLDPAVEQCVYRIVEEGIRNICHHAQASQFSLSLQYKDNRLTMELTDDGIGFKNTTFETDDHYGVKGMRERAEAVGGELYITSHKKHGTTIRFVIETEQK